MLRALVALTLFLVASQAGQSFFNVLNEETGDFGGLPFPLRNEFQAFTEVDFAGDLTSYGFYMPLISRMGLQDIDAAAPPNGAVLVFDSSVLPKPEQLPFKFIGINYNPGGHPGVEYLVPHFDVHVWLESPEYARSIECNGTDFPPCQVTPALEAKFANTCDSSLFPDGYSNNAWEWVPTMGAHLIPTNIPDTFGTEPAHVFGSYDGKLIFHEPMIANTVFFDIEVNGTKEFNWPQTDAYPTGGRFYQKFSIEVVNDRYKITFKDLHSVPHKVNNVPIFTGALYTPTEEMFTSPVAGAKNCLISTSGVADGGYLVTTATSTYCCRARGDYAAGSCTRNTCGGTAPLTSPVDAFFFSGSSSYCYARCYSA